ncbi:hypothetical protein GKZ68_07065 [Hymenobacter sp. BRD128]|uniref:hypothetical protein n=1 Tax=Hymenobacter sp. BRD128 TaxID=2675878 RepID=UPI001563245E|nr:hypothetical protein [Hymenobacter sp. BRD128]QKG56414.1 hypothetical protein GKZ68_07065 [Hymenobacter sp. BRD128]
MHPAAYPMKLNRMSWLASYRAVLPSLLLAAPMLAPGQALPHQTGKIATEQVALAYETFGLAPARCRCWS